MLPALPVTVIEVELPEQMIPLVATAVPPVEAGFTITVAVVELAELQTPLVTMDR